MRLIALENMLASICSVETGLSEDVERKALRQHLSNERIKNQIQTELANACSDGTFSWIGLLDNDKYCVFPAESEEEAKAFIFDKLNGLI
jgi:hypothetical protein